MHKDARGCIGEYEDGQERASARASARDVIWWLAAIYTEPALRDCYVIHGVFLPRDALLVRPLTNSCA